MSTSIDSDEGISFCELLESLMGKLFSWEDELSYWIMGFSDIWGKGAFKNNPLFLFLLSELLLNNLFFREN